MIWNPSHIGSESRKHRVFVPDSFFLLSHAADKFAEMGARLADLPMHIVSGPLWRMRLVSKIQRRLVRIIISVLHKCKYEAKCKHISAARPSLEDIALVSQHNLEKDSNEWECINCNSRVGVSSPNIRHWLHSACKPIPFDDRREIVPIPRWHVVMKVVSFLTIVMSYVVIAASPFATLVVHSELSVPGCSDRNVPREQPSHLTGN